MENPEVEVFQYYKCIKNIVTNGAKEIKAIGYPPTQCLALKSAIVFVMMFFPYYLQMVWFGNI